MKFGPEAADRTAEAAHADNAGSGSSAVKSATPSPANGQSAADVTADAFGGPGGTVEFKAEQSAMGGPLRSIRGDAGTDVHPTTPLFNKCVRFKAADEAQAVGLYPYFRVIESAQDTEVFIDGKKMLMLGSNSYMGLTNDPRVKEATIAAVKKYGSGCAGSRFLNGTLDIHIQLEEDLAKFCGKEASLVYATGYQANLGAISAIVGREDHVFLDRFDHACIVDGARLSFGKTHKFVHNDTSHLASVLNKVRDDKGGKLIIVDGVYSMEGDIARLPDIVKIAKQHDAAILVDDAHGMGVLGPIGNGTAAHFGLTNEVDLIMGTFSKSLATIGGWIAGDREVITFLKHHARSLIFSASAAPACVAAAKAALDIIIAEPERRKALWDNTHFMMKGLKDLGFDIGHCESPIMPIIAGDYLIALKMWRALHDAGIFVNPVLPPATPPDRALLRISVMATHTQPQLEHALEILGKVGAALGVIKRG